jgi:hypothetical protein
MLGVLNNDWQVDYKQNDCINCPNRNVIYCEDILF